MLASLVGAGRAGMSLTDAALVMFARRRWVREDALRSAYHAWLDSVENWLKERTGDPFIGDDHPLDDDADRTTRRADEAARRVERTRDPDRLLKKMRDRLTSGANGELSPADLLHSALTCLAHAILTGEESYGQALSELFDATGIDAQFDAELDLADGSVLHRMQSVLKLDELRSLTNTVSIAELEQGRDMARMFAPWFSGLHDTTDKDVACLALWFAGVRRQLFLPEVRRLDGELANLKLHKSPPRRLASPGGPAPKGVFDAGQET